MPPAIFFSSMASISEQQALQLCVAKWLHSPPKFEPQVWEYLQQWWANVFARGPIKKQNKNMILPALGIFTRSPLHHGWEQQRYLAKLVPFQTFSAALLTMVCMGRVSRGHLPKAEAPSRYFCTFHHRACLCMSSLVLQATLWHQVSRALRVSCLPYQGRYCDFWRPPFVWQGSHRDDYFIPLCMLLCIFQSSAQRAQPSSYGH